jgi:hypothetical protein
VKIGCSAAKAPAKKYVGEMPTAAGDDPVQVVSPIARRDFSLKDQTDSNACSYEASAPAVSTSPEVKKLLAEINGGS